MVMVFEVFEAKHVEEFVVEIISCHSLPGRIVFKFAIHHLRHTEVHNEQRHCHLVLTLGSISRNVFAGCWHRTIRMRI